MKVEAEIVPNDPGKKQGGVPCAKGSGQGNICHENRSAKACGPSDVGSEFILSLLCQAEALI